MTQETEKTIVVYHNNEMLAKRGYRPRAGETVAYRGIKDWNEFDNKKFDEVVDLSTEKPSYLETAALAPVVDDQAAE